MKSYVLLAFIMSITCSYAQTSIKMEQTGGVYKIPCKVNGLSLKFIFDTGASDVSISLTEALFMLKNDYMSESDFIGTEHYRIANGDIEEGTRINLKSIEIGGQIIHNVTASITHTIDAPLLLGQSAMQKFGKFSIDYSAHILFLGGSKSNNNPPTSVGTQKSKAVFKVTDVDGNVYDTVKIGSQIWMKQNLKTAHYNDGSPITESDSKYDWGENFSSQGSTPAWCYCDGNSSNNDDYGYLYNWFAVTDSRNLCPTGWHIPTEIEFEHLSNYLGGDGIAGGKLKSKSLWVPPNTSANNTSGFSAIPSGYRFHDGDYVSTGKYSYYWSSTQDTYYLAWGFDLRYNEPNVHHLTYSKCTGRSVRCIKD